MVDTPLDTPEVDDVPVSVLEMSDEDYAKLPLTPEIVDEPKSVPDDSVVTSPASTDVPGDGVDSTPVPEADKGQSADPVTAVVTDESKDTNDKTDDKPSDAGKDPVLAAPAPDIDYKAEYEKLTAPFKANGVNIQVKDSAEIKTLMEMGANYHKKMTSLKPALKIVKLLEKNNLMDEEKLSFLIDLNSKDPAAITKFIKDSGVDPLSLDVVADSNYTPKSHKVSDSELKLDEVLESIQGTPTYARTMEVVAEQWDETSRIEIAGNPHIMTVINAQIADGTFDMIHTEVERARRLGKLPGVSDFDAYKQMGNYLDTIGAFKKPELPVQVNADQTAQKKVADDKRKAAKKAATITTGKVAPVKSPSANVLNMSDEEFEKLPPIAYTKL